MRHVSYRAALISTSLVMFGLAASCSSAPPAAPPPPPAPPLLADGDVLITIVDNTCTVEPAKVVIDYPTSKGKPVKVKFKVKKAKEKEVRILAAQGQVEPDLFGPLPKFEKGKDYEEKEANPKRTPPWQNGEFKFTYKVAIDDVICDPEICIRQNGSGCSF